MVTTSVWRSGETLYDAGLAPVIRDALETLLSLTKHDVFSQCGASLWRSAGLVRDCREAPLSDADC